MAGIGFELKRVIEKGGILSFLKAAFSGIMIVAGPWLISIVSIYSIGRLIVFLPWVEQQLFIAVVIYSFAFSLILFGGVHFIFTRLMADFIYEKKPQTASSLLIFFSLLVGCISAVIGGVLFRFRV
jgi:polysaccharide biosynthesis protein PelG